MFLITGGTGHVGAYVIKRLVARGERVALFDLRAEMGLVERICGAAARPSIEMIIGDLSSLTEFLGAAARCRPTGIIHLASLMPPAAERDTALSLAQITGGMVNVLEAARFVGTRRVIWASATSVFGAPEGHGGLDAVVGDEAPHRPQTLYGITKSCNERLATLYRTRYGIESLGFRFCQGYGPGKSRGRPYGYEMFEKALLGEPCRVPYGDDIINWQYVEDIAEIIVRALDAPHRGLDVYNTTGDIRTMREAVDCLTNLAPGADLQLEPGLAGLVWRYDATRLAADLGFAEPTRMEDGFAATVETMRRWRKQGIW